MKIVSKKVEAERPCCFYPVKFFELHTLGLLYTFRIQPRAQENNQIHTQTHRQIPLSPLPLFLLKHALPHILLASFTVWIFILFIEEGSALAQKTKGKRESRTAYHDTNCNLFKEKLYSSLLGAICHHTPS